jgi:hypothetical protein
MTKRFPVDAAGHPAVSPAYILACPTHFLPPQHCAIYLKLSSHLDDGDSTFFRNVEHLIITPHKNPKDDHYLKKTAVKTGNVTSGKKTSFKVQLSLYKP